MLKEKKKRAEVDNILNVNLDYQKLTEISNQVYSYLLVYIHRKRIKISEQITELENEVIFICKFYEAFYLMVMKWAFSESESLLISKHTQVSVC
jgi:hypothetical protein